MSFVSLTDIELFNNTKKYCKNDNGINNKIRERILYEIGNKLINEEWYLIDNNWKELKESFMNILEEIAECEYNSIILEHKGGRLFNYDFTINYYYNKKFVCSKNLEFKYNCKKIDKCPQFLNISSKNFVKKYHYAEYLYDNYIEEISKLINIPKPKKIDYMKYIYGTNYDKLKLFRQLKNEERDILIPKKILVNTSIKNFLNNTIDLDIESINKNFKLKQCDKTYLLYHNGTFYKDYITDKELTVTKIEKIKNSNTIILETLSKSKIHMLLRWKNGAGILCPAWQIKLVR